MNRRQVLSALAGAGLTAGSLWVLGRDAPSTDEGGEDTETGLPVTVETLDARGSTAGTVNVPRPATPTLVDLFATWCTPCKRQMDALGAVHTDYADRVAFVSVTNERVGATLTTADIRAWWRANGGNWTVGLDPESDLMSTLGASGLPYLAIADADGTVRWTHSGGTDAATLRDALDSVLDSP